MKRNKMKTKKALAKRVKRTGTGKLKFKHAKTSHMFAHKSTKQKRKLRKTRIMDDMDTKRFKQMLQG